MGKDVYSSRFFFLPNSSFRGVSLLNLLFLACQPRRTPCADLNGVHGSAHARARREVGALWRQQGEGGGEL